MEEEGVQGAPDQVRARLAAKFDNRWNTLDHGDGWIPLVDRLDRQISEIVPDYKIGQVKEKFGGLRYYIGAVPSEVFDRVYALITAAEEESFSICESCGTTENVTTGGKGWVKTYCDECRENRGK